MDVIPSSCGKHMKLGWKMKKGDWVCVIIFLVVLQMAFLWCVDISVSALINQGFVTNGFFINNPMQAYHIGLYGSILNFVILSFILVHFVVDAKKTL